MRQGKCLSFDPLVTAVSGAQQKDGSAGAGAAGGGNITGNGTFYSIPSAIQTSLDIGEVFKFTGTIAGTLTAEIDNSLDEENADAFGTADWSTYDKLNGAGFSGGVATLVAGAISGGTNPEAVEMKRMVFARFRWKLIVTSGTGTVRARRTLKGA